MTPELCANLCELAGDRAFTCIADVERAADDVLAASGLTPVARVSVGSYFCDRLFCSLPDSHYATVADFCSTHDVRATLIVPIFAQGMLDHGMQRVSELLDRTEPRPLFDEVTVNDLGAATRLAPLCRARGLKMNWGRLFQKALRDPRHADFASRARTCEMTATEARELAGEFPLGLVEFDPFAPSVDFSPLSDGEPVAGGIPPDTPYALHMPYCLATTGHICEAASASRPTSQSFRANAPCELECQRSHTLMQDDSSATYYLKRGRTVLFSNPGCETVGPAPARLIWTPAV